jgi:hypothetical protein
MVYLLAFIALVEDVGPAAFLQLEEHLVPFELEAGCA